MKILHTVYDDVENPWCGGGGALRTMQIAGRLSARHDITVLVGAFPGALRQEERDGVRIRRVGSARSYALSRLSFCAAASAEVARGEYDLWVYGFSAYAPLTASAGSRSRSLLEFFHLMGEHATEKFPIVGQISRWAERRVLHQHDHILTISPTVQRQLADMGVGAQLHLVYTGVDDSCFAAGGAEGDYVLYFGRLDIHTKGLDILLRGMAEVNRSDVRLILAGRGTPERQRELRALAESLGIADRVLLYGPADDEQKKQLMSEALLVCMPSRYEGWGIVAIEAGAAGKPVVGTDIPGLRDAIQADETGLLVPSEDPRALAEAIERLLDQPGERQRLGANGRRWAGQFTWDRVAGEQERVYTALA